MEDKGAKQTTISGNDLRSPFRLDEKYYLVGKCVDNAFNLSLKQIDPDGTTILMDKFSITDRAGGFHHGPPGLWVFKEGATFDNLVICPISVDEEGGEY